MTRTRTLLICAATATFALALACNRDTGPKDAAPLGEGGGTSTIVDVVEDEAAMSEAFGLVRATLYGEPSPDASALEAAAGRRAFVCAYGVKPPNVCGTAAGDDLAESLTGAAADLQEKAGAKLSAAVKGDVRLKIDVVVKTESGEWRNNVDRPRARETATYGYWFKDAENRVGWILPSEVLEQDIYSKQRKRKGVLRDRLLDRMRARNPGLGPMPTEFDYDKLRTVSWVERPVLDDSRPDIFRVYRAHALEFPDASPDALEQASVWAADYLISSIEADGEIRYNYRVARDKDGGGYNVLRHGGTTYSILQAYDRTKYAPYLVAAEHAMGWLMRERSERSRRSGPFLEDSEVFFVYSRAEGNTIKLGGAGLALVMIDQYVEVTGDKDKYLEEARGYARFIVSRQGEDGEFIYHDPYVEGSTVKNKASPYYPGEAILGLIRLYSYDRNPLWLETAVRGADWLIDTRDKGKDEKRLANDHWLMIALSYLYQYTKDERYVTHSMNLARAVEYQYEKNRKAWKKYPDYQGGYYDPPRSTPAATRGEGLVAVLDTCKLAGNECGWVQDLLIETVRHELLSLYSPDHMWWPKNPSKAFGGWNGGLLDTSVRNDFVQHNMSSALGLERHLREARGTDLPGGPRWTESNLGGATFDGVPPERMKQLRTWTEHYRGDTRWEKLAALQGKGAEGVERAEGAEPTEAGEPAPVSD